MNLYPAASILALFRLGAWALATSFMPNSTSSSSSNILLMDAEELMDEVHPVEEIDSESQPSTGRPQRCTRAKRPPQKGLQSPVSKSKKTSRNKTSGASKRTVSFDAGSVSIEKISVEELWKLSKSELKEIVLSLPEDVRERPGISDENLLISLVSY